jgi:spermidine/putrescine transport system permease protein
MNNNRLQKLPGFFYLIIVLIFLYLPIALLIILSFNDSAIMAFPLRGYTLHWYQQLIGAGELWQATRNSLLVASISALLSTILGAMAAFAIVRYRFPGRDSLLATASIPLVMPSIVLGAGLLVFFRSLLGLDLSLGLITASHVLINIPACMLIVMARLAGFPKNLEEAAMDLGATPWQTLLRVTLPISLPALLAAFLVAFTTSFDEYAMTTLITGTETTLPVYLYSQLRFPRKLPVVLALGSIIIVGTGIVIVAAEWLRRLGVTADKKSTMEANR